jgi:hypothetical protein
MQNKANSQAACRAKQSQFAAAQMNGNYCLRKSLWEENACVKTKPIREESQVGGFKRQAGEASHWSTQLHTSHSRRTALRYRYKWVGRAKQSQFTWQDRAEAALAKAGDGFATWLPVA